MDINFCQTENAKTNLVFGKVEEMRSKNTDWMSRNLSIWLTMKITLIMVLKERNSSSHFFFFFPLFCFWKIILTYPKFWVNNIGFTLLFCIRQKWITSFKIKIYILHQSLFWCNSIKDWGAPPKYYIRSRSNSMNHKQVWFLPLCLYFH